MIEPNQINTVDSWYELPIDDVSPYLGLWQFHFRSKNGNCSNISRSFELELLNSSFLLSWNWSTVLRFSSHELLNLNCQRPSLTPKSLSFQNCGTRRMIRGHSVPLVIDAIKPKQRGVRARLWSTLLMKYIHTNFQASTTYRSRDKVGWRLMATTVQGERSEILQEVERRIFHNVCNW